MSDTLERASEFLDRDDSWLVALQENKPGGAFDAVAMTMAAFATEETASLRERLEAAEKRIAELERELGAADQYAFDNLTDLNTGCYPHGVLGGEIADEVKGDFGDE